MNYFSAAAAASFNNAQNSNQFVKQIINGWLGKEIGLTTWNLKLFDRYKKEINISSSELYKRLLALVRFLASLKSIENAFGISDD
ncbi:MAG: hypothetical protein V2I36_17335, partial [Desulfopila sp.]|nr:hypothetical protein [Desulfopila sp.]